MKRLGIFGGTFDPIHAGHLIIAEDVREKFSLEKLIFVPAGAPPHKDDTSIISARRRHSMISLAIDSNPYFEVSDAEMDRPGRSYTVDTLQTFRTVYPEPVKLLFIMGLDQALEIPTWKEPERLFSLADILVVSRPGYDLGKLGEGLRGRVQLLQGRSIEISSTEIRRKVRAGESIRYLVPAEVEAYIYDNGLYSR